MELNERKLNILKAIVKDYIETAEAIGSRTISKRHDLGVSAATIRNEMADLEELGYLIQPHTSAGRVPSEKGYKLYVNSLMSKSELDDNDKILIEQCMNHNINHIKELIINKELVEHEKLPPIRKLSNFLQVNNTTIVKVYELLENEGYVYKIIGSGTFVSSLNSYKSGIDNRKNK
ncbi:MAG: GntR family transcriptional regulator, partial [Clostridioides difficile]|nr:GntR family transcriptional regulator [Clostridioides difficile]